MNWEIPFAAVLAFLGGIIAYAIQKRLDRNEQIRARYFLVYSEMVEAIGELANAHNRGGKGKEDALSNYAIAKMKFSIVASDSAMKKFVAFDRRITSGDQVANDEFDKLLADFLKEVRIQNLGGTNLTDEELVIVTPYGRSFRNS